MSVITFVCAGQMNSAITFPAFENGHEVRLVGSPLDRDIIDGLKKDNFHITLKRTLHDGIKYYQIEELAKRIEDAVAALPESYREAFVMHRFRDMSYKEIAEILGISPKTVDYRIQQALKQLRVDLKDYLPLLLPILFP